ncbi:class I SAM-dependent methyltransferase [Variovorax ginsengisoli]|uniref:Methyltransferase domain-containing protein n=1 Tax=Variovorax ginsengisoli TaxID=363844 RepID=A0ABT8RZL5_9BURK|nr:class I SAM-dependent methyltransferase [Variovorax ginsengisoli]MDN8612813.1 methyltransferase domain-containing protein [Variovorax ginsengisoli]MDO1531983.1 methyltransferase domain-containing protein [Variovorax ginsengisoli]
MSKAGEITFFAALPAVELQQAIAKPFGHPERADLLANLAGVFQHLPPPPARILDMGCGTGWTSIAFARAGYDVLGVDIADDAVRIARQQAEGLSARFEALDYESINEANFDAVVFFDCLHHAEDPALAVAAAFKALKPGGVMIANEPGFGHGSSPDSVRAMEQFGVTERSMPSLLIRRLAKKAGFTRFATYPLPRNMVGTGFIRSAYHAVLGRWIRSALTVVHR